MFWDLRGDLKAGLAMQHLGRMYIFWNLIFIAFFHKLWLNQPAEVQFVDILI